LAWINFNYIFEAQTNERLYVIINYCNPYERT